MTTGMSGTVLAAERIEREAYGDVFRAVPAEVATRYGVETAEVGGATCTVASALEVGLSLLNRAVGLGVERPVGETDLGAIVDWFAVRRADLYVQVAAPAAESGLDELLVRSGFEPAYGWMKFVRGPQAPADEGSSLCVRAVEAGEGDVFGSIVARGFAMPAPVAGWLAALAGRDRWRCYVAWDGDEPAGAAGMLVSDGVAWFGFGSVLPTHRGKGAQRALFATRIRDARELGCELLVTETGERVAGRPDFSYANILASGFGEAYLRPAFVRPSS
jgi:GNAT superfamily N-acetyltransferase